MTQPDRPRFRVSAEWQAVTRRVRYLETNRPSIQNCTICQLNEETPADIEKQPFSSQKDPQAERQ